MYNLAGIVLLIILGFCTLKFHAKVVVKEVANNGSIIKYYLTPLNDLDHVLFSEESYKAISTYAFQMSKWQAERVMEFSYQLEVVFGWEIPDNHPDAVHLVFIFKINAFQAMCDVASLL